MVFVFKFENGSDPIDLVAQFCQEKKVAKDIGLTQRSHFLGLIENLCLSFPWNPKRGVDNLSFYRNVNGIDKDEDVQRGRKHFKQFEGS